MSKAALTDEQRAQAEQAVTVELESLGYQLSRALDRPLRVREFLDPALLLDGIDFGSLDRARSALAKLDAAGVDLFVDYAAARHGSRGQAITAADAKTLLGEIEALGAKFDSVRGGKKK